MQHKLCNDIVAIAIVIATIAADLFEQWRGDDDDSR